MTAAVALRRLYSMIPSFACKPGCARCCGPVPLAEAERAALPDGGAAIDRLFARIMAAKIDERVEFPCLTCPHSSVAGCSVYEHRPFMCRLFGTVDEERMRCPVGCGPETLLTAAEGAALTQQYLALMDEEP